MKTAWRQADLHPPFHLHISTPGVLDHLVLRSLERRVPLPGEVEIEVVAAGLNFLDVLLALGVLPDDSRVGHSRFGLGAECAGRITAIGEGVEGLEVGQSVMAVALGSFATHVISSSHMVRPMPPGMSFEQAATVPLVYLTAWYALQHVARLRRGERILIHAAAGGIGLAALQIAQHLGAEIYATAGSDEKRNFLRSLGIDRVFDSRSLLFADGIRAATGGEGVDVVLNSLAGEFIPRSFDLLRDYGRFIELGKRDYYDDRKLGLKPFLRNLAFALVDLRAMVIHHPERVGSLFDELMPLLAAGRLQALRHEVFPISQAVEAFHHMAQARHIGKIVVSFRDREAVSIQPAPTPAVRIRADGTYLITGGLGGLGLQIARWLVENDARHLVLMGRRGPSPEARTAITALEAAGARVYVARADVADRAQVARVLEEVAASMPPLRGVLHSAAVLDDATIGRLTPELMQRVMAPKIDGSWNLHQLTRGLPLDFFILFSSASALLGSPGQANYAAANTFLDALAHHRRAEGLPGLSINWGAWADVGLAAAEANRGERLAYRGVGSMAPDRCLEALRRLFDCDQGQVGVMAFQVRQWCEFYLTADRSPFLSELARAPLATGDRKPSAFREKLLAAPVPDRRAMLEGHLRDQLSQVLRLAPSRIGPTAPFASLGLDSLMGLELRNRLEAGLDLTLATTLIWAYPTLQKLTPFLAGRMEIPLEVAEEATPAPAPVAEPTLGEGEKILRALAALKGLSDADLKKMLSSK